MEILKKQHIIIISIQKINLENEAWSLNAPELLIDVKYKLSIIIENVRDETYNKMANHKVSILKNKDIFSNCCILVIAMFLMKTKIIL